MIRIAAVVVLALSLSAEPARGSLVGSRVHGLAVGSSEVAVRIDSRLLFFDHDGAFRRELAPRDPPLDRAHLLTLTDDGRLWLTVMEDDAAGRAAALVALDEGGTVVARHRPARDRDAFVTPRSRAFVGHVEGKELVIERLDLATSALMSHVQISVETPLRIVELGLASAIAWAVDEQGDVFLLTTVEDKGRLTRYRPDGTSVRSWDVAPDRVTSVS